MSGPKSAGTSTRPGRGNPLLSAPPVHPPARSQSQFVRFYDDFYVLALNYVVRRVRDRELAEEIVAAAFFCMLRAQQRGRWPAIPGRAWVYRVVGNEIRRHFRWTAAYRRALRSWFAGRSRTAHVPAAGDERPDFEQVRGAVADLPERYACVLALRYFERLSTPEIALILEQNESTVRTSIERGLKKLRRRLASLSPTAGLEARHDDRRA